MTDREKMIEILDKAREEAKETIGSMNKGFGAWYADHLIANGVTFSAAVPGHEDQYNIAEMSYNNGYEKGLTDGKNESVKRGRWIIHSNGRGNHATNWAECSECRVCGSPQWKVCPVCEAKMEDT